jgi:predicted RNA-binding protein associated with RNAse of E/G family
VKRSLIPHRRAPGGAPTILVSYRRLPDDIRRFEQELLDDGADCKISLQIVSRNSESISLGGAAVVETGGSILWFVFPGKQYEIAAAHDPDGHLLGFYTNLIRPPEVQSGTWRITDLFLDIWQPAEGEATLLDAEELADGLARGWLEGREAEQAREQAAEILEACRKGLWPPEVVRRWPLAAVPSLRLRRDAPGTWYAGLVVGRVIAAGIYFFGVAVITSLLFAGFSDVFQDGVSLRLWKWVLAAEAAVLAVFALVGRLPATRIPYHHEALTERTLFMGTLAMGLAVFVNRDSRFWVGSLVGVYGALAFFLTIFAVSRIRYDREPPYLALAGLAVSLIALITLL